ncbi:MFS transporter [Nonomuraea typhae]|uniref:MFS transporter n=1 Tax=Nonomuraea typhae TaxID=2603600 RepID=UPI0012F9A839|nr:MFS transporter [Nonomuraea typhae]
MENAIQDWRGRAYRVGPVPSDRPRMFWLAWASMAAIAPLQYGYAALLTRDRAMLVPLAAWIVCQAAGALVRGNPRASLGAGAALTSTGLAALWYGPAWLPLSLYAVLGGLGAGLVYRACGDVVAAWHPERPATRVGLATGAFGYGALPVLAWAGLFPAALPWAWPAWAAVAAAVIGAAALRLRMPPPLWWPDTVDPRAHALDAAVLRRTPGAVRDFSLAQALKTRELPVLAAILVCAGAVSIADVVIVAALAGGAAGAGVLALLVGLNGAGRAVAMRCSERLGRKAVLAVVLALLTLGQLLLAGFAATGAPLALWTGALFAGLGGGAFYPLLASLVRDLFGAAGTGRIHAVVYSAKAAAGLLAVALAWLALTPPEPFSGRTALALLIAAALAALPAVAATRLRAPGLPATIPV